MDAGDAAGVPAGWALRSFTGGGLCVPQRLAALAQAQWFDAARPDAVPVAEGGRQSAWFVDGAHGAAVLRHYRRGGLRARLGRESYFWLGQRRIRALAEVRVLVHLRTAGLRVPEPLGAAWWHHGPMYRNALLMARIPHARALVNMLDRAAPSAVAAAILAMHDAGVWHRDLNAYNILLDAAECVWLIDFDRAQQRPVSAAQRRENLLRLRRSLVKVAGNRGAQWWADLMADDRLAAWR